MEAVLTRTGAGAGGTDAAPQPREHAKGGRRPAHGALARSSGGRGGGRRERSARERRRRRRREGGGVAGAGGGACRGGSVHYGATRLLCGVRCPPTRIFGSCAPPRILISAFVLRDGYGATRLARLSSTAI
eukprot:1056850-Rhodomonas_salina.2